jgi:hypothetical protein
MILNSPTISGSLTVTGNILTSGSITLSGSIASASFAATASFVALAQSASNAVSAQTASFANAFTVAGNLTAQTLVVQTITSSVDFVTGSTRFGSILENTHVFSGSVTMNPGGLFVSASGLVGIGTTNPASGRKLTVAGGAQFTYTDNGGASFNIVPGTNGQDGADFNLSYYTGTGYGPLTFTLGGSERMRIASGGNVGIGTTNIGTEANLHLGAFGTNEGGQLILQKGTSYASASHLDNYQNRFRIMSGNDTGSVAERFSIDMTNGAITTAGPVYRYSGQTVVGGTFVNLTALDLSSSRTYLIQMIPTNTEAGLSYRIFGVIQANATSGTYAFSTIHSQTMDITFSGTTVQARVTNGQQWTFNWSITQLL